MFKVEGLVIRHEVDPDALGVVPRRPDYELLSLNRSYMPIERLDLEATLREIDEESELLDELEGIADRDHLVDILDRRYEDTSQLSELDAGLVGVVAALRFFGAHPISSCNGGVLGDPHTSSVPHVLFACSKKLVPLLKSVAEMAGCSLVNNGRYLELFTDDLRKLNLFARWLVTRPGHKSASA